MPSICNATTRFADGAREAAEDIYSHPECQVPDPEFDSWCGRVISVLEKAKQELIGI